MGTGSDRYPNMSPAPPTWVDLPPELLALVSGRLHEAADFVRFHAACTRWRDSLSHTTALRPAFFPWLIAPPSGYGSSVVKLRCVFSKTTYLAAAPETFSSRRWVARADGSAAWFSAAGSGLTLIDPLTGDVATSLPTFPEDDGKTTRRMEISRGIIYADGTVFLYNFTYPDYVDPDEDDDKLDEQIYLCFNTAILGPGDTAWKFAQRELDVYTKWDAMKGEYEIENNRLPAAYPVDHRMKLVCVDGEDYNLKDTWTWHILPELTGDEIMDEEEEILISGIQEEEIDTTGWYLESCHILESRGELLQVSVLVQQDRSFIYEDAAAQASALVVWVHALEEDTDADGGRRVMRWARRDGRSFSDRVMFLGFPTSFAVEATKFPGEEDYLSGGCVYLLQHRRLDLHGSSSRGVFRYNLLDDKAKFIEQLPPEWSGQKKADACLWFMPQPSIAPIQVIRERLEAPRADHPNMRISTFRMEERPKQPKVPLFRFLVQNLPPAVDSSRLCTFFGKHGQVLATKMISPAGTACVIMFVEMVNRLDDAEATLDGLVLDGCTLTVKW
ncbi:hypothetical protein CFC21_079198 [Triticum aestivum]|uniref:RRM domain-containing protein n=2 Tax=Triticum aestivum TaxID=4565 RepID=A0A9R1L1L0_WHEAT|nr:uncharacterized protein LOC123125425 [Triticum aestivum]KAF7074300.1 hypothetical protein CFC21_079198 [Triticum aestivum]